MTLDEAPLYPTGVPDFLRSREQYLMWDKSADTPRRPHWRGDFGVSWSDPDEWSSFADAVASAEEKKSWGIGYVTAVENDDQPSGMVAVVDLDGAAGEDGELKDWVPDLDPFLERGKYLEWSPSRDEAGDSGIHIPILGFEPPAWFSDVHFSDDEHEGVDLLTNKFCTVTGDALEGAGDEPARWSDEWVVEWLAECYEAVSGESVELDDGGNDTSSSSSSPTQRDGDRDDYDDDWPDEEAAEELLEAIDPDCAYNKWRNIGFALADQFPESTARRLFESWSRSGTKYDDEAERFVEDIAGRGSGGIGIGTLIHHAEQAGWEPSSSSRSEPDLEIPTAEELVARESDEFDTVDDVPEDWFERDDDQDELEDDQAESGDESRPAPAESGAEDAPVRSSTWEFGDRVRSVLRELNDDDADMGVQRARHEIAVAFTDSFDFVRPEESVSGWRDTLYVYTEDAGIYEPRAEAFIKRKLEAAAGEFATNQVTNEVAGKIERMSFERGRAFNTNPNRLVVENGILDLHAGELDDHTPDEYHRTNVPVAWNPDAGEEPEAIDEFLHDVVEDGDVPTLYRMIAHTLYKEYATEKAAMLVGSGENGKSLFLEFVERFIGDYNTSHRSLQDFEDRFAANALEGKLANIHPDMGSGDVHQMDVFKKLTGRDTMQADVKFESPIEFENFATLIFAANELPVFEEDNHAVWRRWVFVDFPYTFSRRDEDAKDPEPKRKILDRVTRDEELEALLVKCQQEIQRWYEGGQWYADAKGPEEVRAQMKQAAEPVYAFATACLEDAGDEFVTKDRVRDAYNAFANEEDLSRIPENEFGERLLELRELSIESGRRRVGNSRKRVYEGIQLTARARQLLELDAPDDDDQAQMGDELDDPNAAVLQRLAEMAEMNDGDPVERSALEWSVPDMGRVQVSNRLDKLKKHGDVIETDEGVMPGPDCPF